MSVETPEALERSVLESKDREQLLAIASALGVKANCRAKKGDTVDRILEQVRGESAAADNDHGNGNGGGNRRSDTAVAEPPAAERRVAEPLGADAAVEVAEAIVEAALAGDLPAVIVAVVEADDSAAPDLAEEPPAEWELAFGGADTATATTDAAPAAETTSG